KTIAPQHGQWLEARGILPELAAKFGLHTTIQSFATDEETPDGKVKYEKAAALSVPFVEDGQVINHKHRRTSNKQSKMDKGARLVFCNKDALKAHQDQPLIITEGEWDMLVAIQCGFPRTVSVPNGAPEKPTQDLGEAKRYQFLWDARDTLLTVKRFIIATDSDASGQQLRAELIQFLGPVRCSFVDYPDDCKDLNDVLMHHGADAVVTCLNHARPVPVSGLHKLSAFPDGPELPMTDLLIPGLEGLFGFVPSTFSVITGYAGHGKTSLVMKMIANLLASGTNVTIGSFETLPKPILERKLLACMAEVADHDPTMWRNAKAREILERRLTIIANTPDEEHELDLDKLIELMEAAVLQHETRLIVLDPYNEIEHKRNRDESETEYAGRFIRTIKRFCHRTGCAVWLIAHPRKPHTDGVPRTPSLYDLSGSANFANKADYGLVAHRPDMEAPE
ncbi:MAG TPA: AAA family ATPase, partial [Propionibacteriaceae bacterium]|nr:AAA family ATPase [Propionibacteriaceae bacterium]